MKTVICFMRRHYFEARSKSAEKGCGILFASSTLIRTYLFIIRTNFIAFQCCARKATFVLECSSRIDKCYTQIMISFHNYSVSLTLFVRTLTYINIFLVGHIRCRQNI